MLTAIYINALFVVPNRQKVNVFYKYVFVSSFIKERCFNKLAKVKSGLCYVNVAVSAGWGLQVADDEDRPSTCSDCLILRLL